MPPVSHANMPPTPLPIEIHPGRFSLNVSGVAGFFGGDEAISAIHTIHYYDHRKWMGWYNSPGSWNVGKKFGKLAKSRFWDGLFPGPDEEPAKFFELDGKEGPKYVASRSGTILEHTGHLAYLIMEKSKQELGYQVKGERITKQNKVTIVKTQPNVFDEVNTNDTGNKPPALAISPRSGYHTLVAILPMAISFTSCGLCGWTHDWFCFSMILLGIVSNGIFSTAPPGDGMLIDRDNVVVLLGREEDVATITRGRFILEYNPWVKWRSRKEKKYSVSGDGTNLHKPDPSSDTEKGQDNSGPNQGDKLVSDEYTMSPEPVIDEYNAIGSCSLLLVIQLLAQLLLIPQGTLFGQIMFLSSFAASWGYNLYLSSIDNEYIQERLILEKLQLKEKKHIRTYVFRTRTAAAVFACLMLHPADNVADKWNLNFNSESIIRNLIPNDTKVWVTFRQKVSKAVMNRSQGTGQDSLQMSDEEGTEFGDNDKALLKQLLKDAGTAYDIAMKQRPWLENY